MSRDTDSPASAHLSGTGADPLTTEQRAWVNALRSGEYKQGREVLMNSAGQCCCLGIACELAVKAGVPLEVEEKYDLMQDVNARFYDDKPHYPPPPVLKWLGLRDDHGTFGGAAESYDCLALRNDQGESFEQIADLIEKHADVLFVEPNA